MSSSRVVELLTKAREIYAKAPAQAAFAYDANDNRIDPEADNAVTFCAMGAVYAASKRKFTRPDIWRAVDSLDDASEALFGDTVAVVNDGPLPNAYKHVLEVYDKAIADATASH